MKYTITALLLFITTASSAQNVEMTKGIHDDGKTLRLKYKATVGNKFIDYENTFDVTGWTKQQKDLRVNNIIDSLHNAASNTKKATSDYSKVKIDDNGSQMTISVDYKSGDQNINYINTYDVKGKTQKEKDAILNDVLKGLGVK
jgi:hypothetical protein